MRKRSGAKGFIIIAFGAGLLVAYCFPSNFVIIALALILVVAGIILLRS